jgi:hypothetical protein
MYGALQLAWWSLPHPVVLVHGDASGGDKLADRIWTSVGLESERHAAIWRPGGIYDPYAGRDRNEFMVRLGAHLCLAFIRNHSRGATHCFGLAVAAGIPTWPPYRM